MLYRIHTCPDKSLSRMILHSKEKISPEPQKMLVGKNSAIVNNPSAVASNLDSFSSLTEHDRSFDTATTVSSACICGSYTTSNTISSSIPIPGRSSFLSPTRSPVVQDEIELVESERRYTLSTWRMYHRIRNYRKSKKISNQIDESCDLIPDHYTYSSRNTINNGHRENKDNQRNEDNNGIFELEI